MKFSLIQKMFSFIRKSKVKFLGSPVIFGENVYLGRGCSITGIYSLKFGNNIYIGKNVTIEVEGIVGSGVIIANNVGIVGRKDHDVFNNAMPAFFAKGVRENKNLSLKTIVGNGCWIGYGAIIMSGITIGENSVIAAGSVVLKDVPDNCIVAGNPAKIVNKRGL